MPSCLSTQAVRICTNPSCSQFTTSTAYVLTNPQPTQYTTCSNLLAAPVELSLNEWSLTTTQGTSIAVQIAIVWAIAYVFRMLISSLKSNEGVSNEP